MWKCYGYKKRLQKRLQERFENLTQEKSSCRLGNHCGHRDRDGLGKHEGNVGSLLEKSNKTKEVTQSQTLNTFPYHPFKWLLIHKLQFP